MQLLKKAIEHYAVSKSTLPSRYCEAIFRYTKKHHPMSRMVIGELEASFLGFLVSLVRAQRILEIGCFTGYSALAMAERLPKNGEVITLEINSETAAIAKQFWQESPHGHKIKLVRGEAIQSLKKIRGPFDFVFIDADKENYLNYLKKVLALLSPNGMIAVDNCLWGGDVLNRRAKDLTTQAIITFNNYVRSRKDLEVVLVPIRDGVFLIRKKK